MVGSSLIDDSASTAGAQVRSLVGELRSCIPYDVAKKKIFFEELIVEFTENVEATSGD